MLELIIFVGLQGAGKSTFYRERFATTHALVSKDLMRDTRQKQARQMSLIAEALAAESSVVVDNTNPTPADRALLITAGHEHGAQVIGYHFATPFATSLARNAQRTGIARVPEIAIYATRKRLVAPTYDEGFDQLWTVMSDGVGKASIILVESVSE